MGKSKSDGGTPSGDKDDKVAAAWYDAWDPKERPADYPKPSKK